MPDPALAPAPGPQDQGQAMPPSDGQGPLGQIILQVDQGLSAVAQVLSKASPEAANALAQLGEQYRQIIQSVLSQGDQPQGQGAPEAGPPEAGGNRQAYQAL